MPKTTAIAANTASPAPHTSRTSVAWAGNRLGHFKEAAAVSPRDSRFYVAMAEYRLGNVTRARQLLHEEQASWRGKIPGRDPQTTFLTWEHPDWCLLAEIQLREAEKLIEPDGPKSSG